MLTRFKALWPLTFETVTRYARARQLDAYVLVTAVAFAFLVSAIGKIMGPAA